MCCQRNLLIVILLIAILLFAFYYKPSQPLTEAVVAEKEAPFLAGEKIVYAVKMGPVRMGTATLSYSGRTKLGNRELETIVFVTTGLNFLDTEKIYAEPKTFYPVRVERTLNLWGRKMDIVEDYDSKDNSWRLTKKEDGKVTEEVFREDSRVQNIIAVVYFYRQMGELEIGKSLDFNFSKAKVKLRVTKIVDFPLGDKTHQAYLLESVPHKYRVWLDAGDKRIPLRIDGSLLGFGNMAMIMREYN